MKSSPLHFGVIGTSGIASTHLEELNKLVALGEAKIVAVADLDEKKGKLAAEVYQCDYYQNYLELLKRRDIAVINICVPSGLHSEVTIEAARSGKHVIVEKPMDISLAKAEKMIRECNKAGVTLSVVMQNRFAPAVQQVKSALEQGWLGQPLLINASVNWYRSQSYYDVSSWRGTWAMDGGGAVLNQGIHTVDLVLYLMGQHKEMSGFIATRGHERIEVEDVASCTMKFEMGRLVFLVVLPVHIPVFMYGLRFLEATEVWCLKTTRLCNGISGVRKILHKGLSNPIHICPCMEFNF
ncbi:Gfo/Idh/MocA family protein [Ectobacillus funiculus]